MRKLTTRLTAMMLSGILVIGSAPGSVFAADADAGQISEYAKEVFTEEEAAEESSETADTGAEVAEENVADTSEETAAQYYTVTLDANGGYFENEWDDSIGDYVQQAEVVEKQIPVEGTVAAFPVYINPNGQSMVFAGWSLEREGELISQADEEYIPVDNCTLYAVWQAEDVALGGTGGQELVDEGTEQADSVQDSEEVYTAEETEDEVTSEGSPVEEDVVTEFTEDISDVPVGAGETTQVEETSEEPVVVGDTLEIPEDSKEPAEALEISEDSEQYSEDYNSEVLSNSEEPEEVISSENASENEASDDETVTDFSLEDGNPEEIEPTVETEPSEGNTNTDTAEEALTEIEPEDSEEQNDNANTATAGPDFQEQTAEQQIDNTETIPSEQDSQEQTENDLNEAEQGKVYSEDGIEFNSGVIVVPEGTEVSVNDDNDQVTITDCPVEIKEGDVFLIYVNGVPIAYITLSVSAEGNKTILSVEKAPDTIYSSIEEEGVIEIDEETSSFVPASDSALSAIPELSYGDLHYENGKVWAEISGLEGESAEIYVQNMSLQHSFSEGGYSVVLTGECGYSGNMSITDNIDIPLGEIRIYGVGVVKLDMSLSASMGMSVDVHGTFSTGVSVSSDGTKQIIRDFTADDPNVQGQGELKLSIKASAGVDILVVSADLYAEFITATQYTSKVTYDQNKDKSVHCQDYTYYIYTEVGGEAKYYAFWSGKNETLYKDTLDLPENIKKPLKFQIHFEDGVRVSSCSYGMVVEDLDFGVLSSTFESTVTTDKRNRALETSVSLPGDLVVEEDYTVSNGTLDLNGHVLTIEGNLIQTGGEVYIHGGRLIVKGDYCIQGPDWKPSEGYLRMDNSSDQVDIEGDFIVQSNKVSCPNSGIIRLKGDFKQYNTNKVTENFSAGNGLTFSMCGGDGQTIFFEAHRDNSIGFLRIENNIYVDGDITLNGGNLFGHILYISGDLWAKAGELYLNGGKVDVTGNVYFAKLDSDGHYGSSAASLKMDNASDVFIIGGDLITNYEYRTSRMDCNAGRLQLGGDWTNLYNEAYYKNIRTSDAFELVLTGSGNQGIYNNSERYTISVLTVENPERRSIVMKGALDITKLNTGGVSITAQEEPELNFGTTAGTLDISGKAVLGVTEKSGGDITVDGDLTCQVLKIAGNNMTVNGDFKLVSDSIVKVGASGILTINGELYQTNGTMNLDGGTLRVNGNYTIASRSESGSLSSCSGRLYMTSISDLVIVGGDYSVFSSNSSSLTAGTMKIAGNFTQLSNSGSDFAPSGTHEVILNGDQKQIVKFTSSNAKFNRMYLEQDISQYEFSPDQCWKVLEDSPYSGILTKPIIYRIVITPNEADLMPGEEVQFTAKVVGINKPSQVVSWTLSGNTSNNTHLSDEGALVIALDEEGEQLAITATSLDNEEKSATAIVNIYRTNNTPTIRRVIVSPNDATIAQGDSETFSATITGTNHPSQSIVWTLSGNSDQNTFISNKGILVIGDNEPAGTLTVTATSAVDSSKQAEVTVKVVERPTIHVSYQGAPLFEGEALPELSLEDGDTEGTVTLDEGQTLTASSKMYTWTFVPEDTDTYAVTNGSIELKVSKKEPEVIDLSDCLIELNADVLVYSGIAKTPELVVSIDGKKLMKGSDYEVSYKNNTNVGTATVTITGKDNYTGTISKTFTISAASIAKATVSGISNKTYTGVALTQNPTIKVGDKTLKKGTDYTVSYANNINVGTATVTITGRGNYASKKNVTFKIYKAAQSITTKAAASRIAVGKTTTVSITGNKGTKSFKSSNTTIATVDSKTGKVTAKKVGTVKITATSAATANYNAASKSVTIKVVPAATASLTATNQATGIKLTWKKVTGANGYKVYRGSTLIKTITSGSTVTFADTAANTNGTKYTYKIVAKASTGDSTLSKSVAVYRVDRPAISSVTNSAASKMTVKWGKNAKANGYQIQYSLSSSFASGNKAVTITSASTVSKVIGSLTKGKTYYIRIRTYKTVGSTKYWSEWSAKKSVKISK